MKGNSAAILYRQADGTPVLRSLASLSLDEDSEMDENEHIIRKVETKNIYS